jgi:MSHA biogenesis protein MshO
VSNRGIAGANAYLLANVITAASQIEISNGGAPNEEDHIKLTPGTNFPTPPTSSRIFLVSGPVTYICNSAANARTVRRYEKYLINQNIPVSEASAQLNGAGVVNTIIARDVTACQLRCSAGSTSPCQGGLVADMIVSRAVNAGNDFIKVFAQLPVENTP